MATNPFDPSPFVGANPFDIYTDTSPAGRNGAQLSGGSCHFVDLSPGANGARCGCRRFWSRRAVGSLEADHSGFCMCNHHACYHDEGSRDAQLQAPMPEVQAIPGQENERPRTGREPLSPVMDMSMKIPPAASGLDMSNFSPGGLSFLQDRIEEGSFRPQISASPRPGGSIPDTLDWGVMVQPSPSPSALPPIPPQCLMPSQTASTTSSVQAKYLRPFAGKGLQTLSGSSGPKWRSSPQEKSKAVGPMAPIPEDASNSDNSFVFVTQDQGSASNTLQGTPTQAEPRAAASSSVSRRAFKNLSETVGAHEQRLDRLETVSFSAPGHEECHEKHDHTDLRITELETKVEEFERYVSDNNSVVARCNGKDDASVVSATTSLTSRPTHSQELFSQVQSLQAQVSHLQALMPTISHPWEVEVVFLPFPLKKVWQDFHLFKNEPQPGCDEWTQLPMTHSTVTMRSQSPFHGEWASPDHEADWLLPKACGDKGLIDRRLRSRGLVKTLLVRGADARSVNIAMNSAFGGLFREMQMSSRPQMNDPRISRFLGLQSSWVPLRKIHKDSRLRFLSPAEMLTPAMWDVQFLSTVMMRSSEPRLFVTHPDAYLQDYQAYETGWTWQRLKEMNPAHPDVDVSQYSGQGGLRDECWSWNEQLDEQHVAQPSSRQRVSISPSQQYFPAIQAWRATSPAVARAQSPMTSRRGSRPPYIRTASVPVSGPGRDSPVSVRRLATSSSHGRRSSPAVRTTSQSAVMKRRRTRSPSHARFTPRWTASPSPMPTGFSERHTGRGTTPFAYATPHSNAPLQEVRPVRGSSVLRQPPEYPSDEDYNQDIEIYESGSEGLYDDDDEDDESIGHIEMVQHAQYSTAQSHLGQQLPEDEVWPGIEDQDHLSDGENIDPREIDQRSDVSSQPSEYPSTQRAWPAENAATAAAANTSSTGTTATATGFQIHEDDDLGRP